MNTDVRKKRQKQLAMWSMRCKATFCVLWDNVQFIGCGRMMEFQCIQRKGSNSFYRRNGTNEHFHFPAWALKPHPPACTVHHLRTPFFAHCFWVKSPNGIRGTQKNEIFKWRKYPPAEAPTRPKQSCASPRLNFFISQCHKFPFVIDDTRKNCKNM